MKGKDNSGERKALHAIVNNFHAVRDGFMDCRRLKYCVSRIKEETGASEQAVIVRLMWSGLNHDKEFSAMKESFCRDYDEMAAVEK